MNSPRPDLPEDKFEIEESEKFGGCWSIKCRHCGIKWRWPDQPMTIGTILHLLNHYAEHEQ